MQQPAQQGHRYSFYWGGECLAMESGEFVSVREIVEAPEGACLLPAKQVSNLWLDPLPMKYFHGEVPRG